MRHARQEALHRVGGRYDVRVLEPSPPADKAPPFFADDPVAGGEVVPVERIGARSWSHLCEDGADVDLEGWCRDRWLVRGPLAPLPRLFAETRESLHAVAEHVLVPARHAATGKIGLRFTYHGFGTPYFGDDRQLRIEDGQLVDGDRRHRLSTLGEAAAFLGTALGASADVYPPTRPCDPDAPLMVDNGAARALGDWYGYCASLLEQLRAESDAADGPGRVQLWPEHFDLAVDLGPDGRRANYGGSPGDEHHAEPYLYVGPFEGREGSFWNAPFGAVLGYSDILAGADGLEFLRAGRKELER
jgi:hypothetical protein